MPLALVALRRAWAQSWSVLTACKHYWKVAKGWQAPQLEQWIGPDGVCWSFDFACRPTLLTLEAQSCRSIFLHECKLMSKQPSGIGLQDGLDKHFHRAILKNMKA